ncbi:unnamed protein product [Rhizoctonia solani]|uniref:L-tryptophan decarboxylase PsiD-like domain-containing protein n=1 Tax=Rhizoctonia solani TaxID=456999 RepID=A0A8H3C7A2_9AGAM|nr:unnamed protein product [Rhizoctonia solani]
MYHSQQPNIPHESRADHGGRDGSKRHSHPAHGSKSHIVHHRVGGWLPKDHSHIERHIANILDKVKEDKRPIHELHPTVVEFKQLIDTTPALRMGFTQMFEQVPNKPPYNKDTASEPQIRDYETMFKAFDYIITHSIPYDDQGSVCLPISSILDWPMGTDAGLATFLIPAVNAQFKKMFDAWAEYLSSPASREYLTTEENGWFSPQASQHIPNFTETYICDPSAEYYGFKSWDDFFTRKFREGARPIEFATDDDIINSACESSVFKISENVKGYDRFWLKGEPYSLRDMLSNDPYTEQFVGGTIYQAFLSAYKYHRWASPVNGTIDRVERIPGTYYAESPAMGFHNPEGPDPAGPNRSQAYITALAARAVIWIKSNNSKLGMIGFIAVGMNEVSTCEVIVKPGDKVKKGDELGMFHFGGSTYCLVFRRGVKINFDDRYTSPDSEVLLNAAIASIGENRRLHH